MMKSSRYWVFFIFAISIIAIASALIAEYIFEILPCKICIYQRYIYYFIIFLSIVYFFINKISFLIYLWILELSLFLGFLIALWHVGIEKKIISGPSSCTIQADKSNSLLELKKQILNQDIILCDEITWSILNISAASINSILLLLLLLFNTILLKKNIYDN